MSNPAQVEPGPLEPPAVVFARLADVPVDALDKLIEATHEVYDDLNKVLGHPYWGDLVYHQGAAMKALKEARICLEGLRSEAVGARNTELGVTVTTAVVGGERFYAQTEDDRAELVDKVLRPPQPGAAHLYVWDRPHRDPEAPGPYLQVRIVTDPEEEVGVLNFTEESEDGEMTSWHTLNPEPSPEAPALPFDAGSTLKFPRNAVLPFRELRAALDEFTRTGQRPEAVQWQTARWGDL
ncbi:Immunity protein Imm1 [Saccharopolyspora kobensis]|uniref:Immunity protein Imm1 n=1 Tax=Saccharopolyspora kobensis TaxID=146035 RepID=A0A1H5TR55_9PSEU|nr:Imm1 family immunity protein [Saccharopolyspora kobensis]SEF64571.1 Immunity protein Imm1 [Saccharopolyspora kobensis]SFC44054.1 Immunity protein Imm1 [Saccharopolyspora kobensis]